MRPETEYVARQLAAMITADDGQHPGYNVGVGIVEVEMRGMVQGIRRQILLDHAAIAKQIGDEIERQAAGVNIGATIHRAVERAISEQRTFLETTVARVVKGLVEEEVDQYARGAVQELVRSFKSALIDVAIGDVAKALAAARRGEG
jgi:low affinity Fe/Cu permease